VLRPPKGATPICPGCGEVLVKQPIVRPIPLLILITVGSVLVLSSFPILLEPLPSPPQRPTRDERAV